MQKANIALVWVLFFGTTLIADKLPSAGFTVLQSSRVIRIYGIQSAKVVKDNIQTTKGLGGTKFTSGFAVLEIVAEVEGNLLTGEPAGVATSLRPGVGSVLLGLHVNYPVDPFSFVLSGGEATSSPTQVSIPLQISVSYAEEKGSSSTFEISTLPEVVDSASRPKEVLKRLVVSHKPVEGFKIVIK